jgi:hypothetical protein
MATPAPPGTEVGMNAYPSAAGRPAFKRFALSCALAAMVACAPWAAAAPGGRGDAPAAGATAAIDSAVLMRDLAVLAHDSMEGRATGTPGGYRARAFMERSFRERGLQPYAQRLPSGTGASFLQPFGFNRRSADMEGANVVGVVPGRERPGRYIVITAHYDHLGIRNGEVYNGADDNASGSAALLALAGYFAGNPPRHSIIFAAMDAEEMGLQGARAFVAEPPAPLDSIAININMDMIGRSDAGELYVAGTHHYPHLLPYVESVADHAGVRLIPGHDAPGGRPGDDWTMLSDHAAFHAAGVPFLYFGVEDHQDYHRATDDLTAIQPGFYVRAVRTILDMVRLLDAEL